MTKLNPDGSALVSSNYLGGSDFENIVAFGASIAVDSTGAAYVTGETRSSDFPTVTPLQPAFGGGPTDVFLAKLNPEGSALVYSTYVGGSGDEGAGGVAVDSSGNAYVAGSTRSPDFPVANALQPAFAGGLDDAFVAKVNAAGSAFVYATYLGGAVSGDSAGDIAVDAAGNAYVTGTTFSSDFPTAASSLPKATVVDAFVAKLDAAGSALLYSTFLGGNNANSARGIAVDSAGNAYVAGRTNSTDLSSAGSAQPDFGGGLGDAFVAKFADDAAPVPPAAGAVQFDMASYSSDEGAGAQTITVTRTGGSAGAVSVDFATADGTALAGPDYTAVATTLGFADGETSKTVSVLIADDTSSEGNETVNLALANPTGGATLGLATAILTIVDNDAAAAPQPPVQGDDGGGCTISADAPFDPLLMLLALAASCCLVARRGGSRRPQG